MICLTCGARDEHSTRSCPISKTCFTCGMKGHINRTCPNRYSAAAATDKHDDCDRCGSTNHKTNECPTLWRIYHYVSDDERLLIIQSRAEKRGFALGQGGEGYIATDEWCYNCGNCGHLGDDCDEVPHIYDIPVESSAFSLHNTTSGPFFDPAAEPIRTHRGPRELQSEADKPPLNEDWGIDAPLNVGREGKKKDRARLEKRYREQDEEDPDDWFGKSRMGRGRGKPVEQPPPRSGGLKFSTSMKDVGRQFMPAPPDRNEKPPSLLARLGVTDNSSRKGQRRKSNEYRDPNPDTIHIRGAAKHSRDQDNGSSRSYRDREQDRRVRDRKYPKQEQGPRYRGGYNR
ncbi:hypothetical protein SERLA73DRAFT_190229 [Serpula lacrymans var. lacrymans S7.3]|uniref:CCHC-type domain-containing protein n=2 Tax=Serpula lacrymans var. lacrymans TaxID=341189 RepID=F8QFA5_SERL3|nr:uncharacterized protein SERLADRAFT_462124 [Serpula lacrymans var. lacrymans S7.9]EGN93064.1 hypothetical protein SERLA73DRAFT_190229 [Serpula lacrymans var. lacrymans S7.3]EGO27899.1 hypothetical protein SERLADRAFT_462124 [Serpula lacrymans var. lacrymans S7.9]